MDPVSGIVASKAIQGVTDLIEKAVDSGDGKSEGGFDSILRAMLSPNSANAVNEEELFAGLVKERIASLKGEEAGQKYEEALTKHKFAMRRGDGYVPIEDAAKAALRDMVSSEVVSAEEADKIHSESFSAAQLDDNHDALYDGRGGPGDKTVATMDIEGALAAARALIEKYDNGEESAPEKSLDSASNSAVSSSTGTSESITPEGGKIDGAGGFVFKPESDHEKKLVVLLPSQMANKAVGVILKDENGEKIEEGRSSGIANGGREHFRFNRAGSDYPENITVEVTLADGTVKEYSIPNPAKRYD